MQVVGEDDGGLIKGIVPTCVVIPVCGVNEVLSYIETDTDTYAFQCINLDTFSGTFCLPSETLTAFDGRPICEPLTVTHPPLIDLCPPNQFANGFDEEGNPICSNFLERTITVANSLFKIKTYRTFESRNNCEGGKTRCLKGNVRNEDVDSFPYLNVSSENIEGIDCGNGKNKCVNDFPQGSDIELYLDIVGWGKTFNHQEMNDVCDFMKRSTTPLGGYECEFKLYKDLTLENLVKDLEKVYIYKSPLKPASYNHLLEINDDPDDNRIGYYNCTNDNPHNEFEESSWTCRKGGFVEDDPFCIDVKATHFPAPNTAFVSKVTTFSKYIYYKSSGLNPIKKRTNGTRSSEKTVSVKQSNTISNPVSTTIPVEQRRNREYQTWIDGDKICSTRGGYSHNPSERSRVGKDTEWKVDIRNMDCDSGQAWSVYHHACVETTCSENQGKIFNRSEGYCTCPAGQAVGQKRTVLQEAVTHGRNQRPAEIGPTGLSTCRPTGEIYIEPEQERERR